MKHCFVALAVASSCLRWTLAVVVTPPDELLGIQSRRGTNIVPNVGDEDSSIMCVLAQYCPRCCVHVLDSASLALHKRWCMSIGSAFSTCSATALQRHRRIE